MAKQQNLAITQGDRFDRVVTFTSPDGSTPSISGAVIWFTIKADDSDVDAAALVQLRSDQVSADGSITPLTTSTARIVVLPAKTATLALGNHYFDLQAVFSATDVSTGVKGRFRINPQTTRSA